MTLDQLTYDQSHLLAQIKIKMFDDHGIKHYSVNEDHENKVVAR